MIWSSPRVLARRGARASTRATWLAVSLVSFLGLAFSASATSPALASTDDFTFASMTVDYELGRSASGTALLTTHEKLVAVFPEIDQNHGIRRAIPLSYGGPSTHPVILAVTDATGAPLAYTAEESDGFLVVEIRADDFVHGDVEYDITYTQDNVISVPGDGGGTQEFYWDVNGTGWPQSFGVVSATIHLDPALAARLNTDGACYVGAEGSTTACAPPTVESTPDGGETYLFRATNLAPFETLTVAVGFAPQTFVVPDTSLWAHPLGQVFAFLTALMVLICVGAIVLRLTLWRSARGRGTIIAQYAAPDGMTPMLAANLTGRTSRGVVASVLRLAVNGNLVIRDHDPAKPGRSDFDLEVVSFGALADDERQLLDAVFEPPVTVGSIINTKRPDTLRARRLRQLTRSVARDAIESGFRRQPHAVARRLAIVAALLAGVAVFFVGGAINVDGYGGAVTIVITYFASFALTVTSMAVLSRVAPLTSTGAQAREHLQGLKLFIRLAEADRVAFLQSPSGAQRRPAVSKPGDMIHLYESALPYAVLFGYEKQWAQSLAALYEENSRYPSWYASNDAFVASAFVVGLNGLASSTSWVASGSYSSGSGSTGGGYAGGGGGGGGGGGV